MQPLAPTPFEVPAAMVPPEEPIAAPMPELPPEPAPPPPPAPTPPPPPPPKRRQWDVQLGEAQIEPEPPADPTPDYEPRGSESYGSARPAAPRSAESKDSYQTQLSPDEEKAFQGWAKKNRAPITDDYDMRGFWKGLQSGDERATTAVSKSDGQLHFPDTWKTPAHATFSNESIYAKGGEPHWVGDVLVAQDGTIVADERSRAEKKKNPNPAVRPVSAARPDLTIDDVLAEKRARWSRHPGVTPEQLASWEANERARLEKFVGAKPATAHIAQSTGPIGTIGTIGKDMPSGASLPSDPGRAPAGGWAMHDDGLKTPSLLDVARLQVPGLMTPPILDAHSVVGQIGTPWEPKEPGKQEDSAKPQTSPDYAYDKTADVQERAMSPEELGQYYSNLSPEEQAQKRGDIEGAKQNFANAQLHEASVAALRQAKENADIYDRSVKDAQRRAAELDAEARGIADSNPMDSISGGQKLAGVLAAIVGGFLPGRNVGLDMVNKIADDAARQQAQRLQLNARQRAAAGEMVGQAGDVLRAQETARLAVYDSAIKKIEADIQNLDPRGSRVVKAMDDANALKAQRAEHLAKFQAEEQKRLESEHKAKLEDDKAKLAAAQFDETKRKNRADEKLEGWKIGESVRSAKAREQHDRDQLALEAAKLRQAGDDKAAERLSERGVGGMVVPTGEVDEKGAPKFAFKMLTNADGKPFEAPTKEEAILVRKKKAAVDTITSLMDETVKLIKEHGWESDFIKSPAWQTMKANWGTVKVKQKDFQDLGAITTADAPLIDAVTGSSDPTQLRNTVPGIEKAFDNTVRQFDDDLRSLNYTGPKYAPVKSWTLPGAPTSAEDVAFKQSLKRPMPTVEEAQLAEDERRLRPPSERYTTEGTATAAQISQQQLITSLVDKMTDASLPQAQRDAARARLERGAEQGQSPEIRDAYQRALTGALGSSIPETEAAE